MSMGRFTVRIRLLKTALTTLITRAALFALRMHPDPQVN
jgi:hypothetical protein